MAIRIREATADDIPGIARVHVDSWRSTYRGIVPDEVLDNLSYQRREEMWHRALENPEPDSFLLAAENQTGEIVGFVSAGSDRLDDPEYDTEIYAVYLREDVQGVGVGRGLFEEASRRLKAAGHSKMLVWVLADNPSRGFYERMGGTPARTQKITIGKELDEVGYGFTL